MVLRYFLILCNNSGFYVYVENISYNYLEKNNSYVKGVAVQRNEITELHKNL